MSGMNNKHILYCKWAIAVVALMVSSCLSPIGMRLLDHFEIKAPLADIALSVILMGITWVVYRLMSRCFCRSSFPKESNDGN
jgi:hypothetical protein